MLLKTRIAAMVANYWAVIDRLTVMGVLKKAAPSEKFAKKLAEAETEDSAILQKLEEHYRTQVRSALYMPAKPAKDDKPASPVNGLLKKWADTPGFGELQISGASVAAVHFKLGLTGTKMLEDFAYALRSEKQHPDVLECLTIAELTPTLKTELVVSYPLAYAPHDWCGDIEEMLSGLERASIRAKRAASLFSWIRANVSKELLQSIEVQHSYLIFSEAKFEDNVLVAAKFTTAETPNGIKQREIKARLEEAIRIRTKKVRGLEVRPNLVEYALEGETNPIVVDLDIITTW